MPFGYSFGDFEVYLRTAEVRRSGEALHLEPLLLKLLVHLIESRDRLVPKEELLSAVWRDSFVTEGALTKAVGRLRRALGDDSHAPRFIQTTHSLGYRFIAEVEHLQAPPDEAQSSQPEGTQNRTGAVPLEELAVDGAGDRPEAGPQGPPSVAVLPFLDLSKEHDQDWFCDGVAEELITSLTRIRGLRVAARTSSFRYRGSDRDVRLVGEELDVGAVLEGSVRKAGDRIRVTVQLIDAGSGYHSWSECYDRKLADVFAIQEDIAESIVGALRGLLSEEERPELHLGRTQDLLAYELYLQARRLMWFLSRRSLQQARDLFGRAVELDPDYALAWCGIADCSSWLYRWLGAAPGELDRAMVASARALKLAPDLAEAHVSRGFAISLDGQLGEATRMFDEAIRLNPDLYDGHYMRARACFAQGRKEAALESAERAAEVRPDDFQAPGLAVQLLREQGLEERARDLSPRVLDLADRHLVAHPDDLRAMYVGAGVLIELGRVEEGLERTEKAIAMDPEEPIIHYFMACVQSRLGHVEASFEALEKALDLGLGGMRDWMEHDGDLDAIRQDPRYEELLARM